MTQKTNRRYIATLLKAKRTRENLTLRDLEAITVIPSSVLNRIENEAVDADIDTLAKLANWLGVSLDVFVRGGEVRIYPPPTTIDKIEAAVMADPALTPENKMALIELFRPVYESITRAVKILREKENV